MTKDNEGGSYAALHTKQVQLTYDQASVVLDRQGELVEMNQAARQLAGRLIKLLADGELGGASSQLRLAFEGVESVRQARRERLLCLEVLGSRQELCVQTLAPGEHRQERYDSANTRAVVTELAHDLNNLLTPLVALSACLEQELSSDAEKCSHARDVRATAERAALFVKRALASMRGAPTCTNIVHPGAVVSEMRDVLAHVAGPEVHVDISLERGSGLVLLDRRRLEAALIDLVVNARDAITGTGRIGISTSNVRIDAQAVQGRDIEPGEYVRVAVSDSGSGISPAIRQRIFERGFTTKATGEGSGLGLHHVQSFVHETQGHIEVLSEPGQGTTFALYFRRAMATDIALA